VTWIDLEIDLNHICRFDLVINHTGERFTLILIYHIILILNF